MKENYLIKCFLTILICFVIDSTISYFLPYNYTKSSVVIVPAIGLMMFALLVKTITGAERYFFAAVCGVYYSIVYSNSLAIYILIYCLIAFVRSYIIKVKEFSMIESSLFCISTIFVEEIVVYWLMWITSTTNYAIFSFATMRLIPTLLFNFVLSFVVYYIYNQIKIEVK